MLLNIFSFTSVPYYFSDTLNLKKFFEFCVKLGQVHPPSHEARPQSYFEQAVPAVSFKIWFTQHLEYIAIHTAVADPDLQIRGGGGHLDPEICHGSDPPLYSTYIAKDNKLKILAVEVLTYVQDPSDLKKKN